MPKIISDLDLNKNAINNAVIQPLTTAPSNPKSGQIYYNTNDKNIYRYNGTSWVTYQAPISTVNGSTISIDSAPTENSTNLVTSGGVYTAISSAGSGLPSQSGQSGKYLTTNGTDASWANAPVTSVNGSTGAVSLTLNQVKQTPLNGANAIRGLLFSSISGASEVTSTVSTSDKLQYSDYNTPALYLYNSDGSKYAELKYNNLYLCDSSSTNKGILKITTLTTDRIYTFPNKGGTVALTSDIPSVSYPVTSVNTKTGAVVLTASDVGALPDSTTIPQGTVTNVAVTNATNGGLSISGSPITSSGTITIGLDTGYGDIKNPYGTKSPHYVLAGPPSGSSSAAPSFRTLVAADIPDISEIYLPLIGGTMLGNIAMSSKSITGLADPSNAQDAATKNYVDTTVGNLTYSDVGAAASSHTHGNITNAGALQTTDIAIASGDKLVVTDSSDSNKVARTSINFDGSTTTQFLSKKGTWVTPSDTKVTQTPLNGTNSTKGLLFSSSTGAAETTNTVYTSDKITYNDSSNTLYLYNSNGSKSASLKYYNLSLGDSSSTYTGSIQTTTLTENRSYILPDKNGTIALTSDIPSVPSNIVSNIETGSTNGTISVTTNGTAADVAVKGLGSNAYTNYTNQLVRPQQLNAAAFYDPTTQALFDITRANRLAFLPASQIIIEKTTDGGTTWVDAEVADSTKIGLFSGTRPSVVIPLLNGVKNINCGVRITFTAMKYNVPDGTTETNKYNYWNSTYIDTPERYCQLQDFFFFVGSNSDGISIKIEAATGAASTTWVNCYDSSGKNWALTGWSGSDYIRISTKTFGGSKTQTGNYWNYRMTFFTRNQSGGTTLSTSNTTSSQAIYDIRGYGSNVWTAANSFMRHDHMYTWDYAKNVTFPANITAVKFIGPVQGNADTATKVGHILTIGSTTFDGSADVTIPIYNGATS